MKSQYKGILYILISAFFFAGMNLFVKLAGPDIEPFQKTLFRNLVATFVAGAVVAKQHIEWKPPKAALPNLIMRSFFGTLGIFANFYAISKLTISEASMLNKLSPFFAILFSYFMMKEKVTKFQIGCVIYAFIGVLCILRPTPSNLLIHAFPAFMGFVGGGCAGFAYTNVRLASQKGAKGPYIVFFFSLFSVIMSFPLFIIYYKPMLWWQLGSLLMAGVCASIAQFAITAAYANAPARDISVYDYAQVIFAAILGSIFLNESPELMSYIGYVIIISAGLIMFRHNRQKTIEAENENN